MQRRFRDKDLLENRRHNHIRARFRIDPVDRAWSGLHRTGAAHKYRKQPVDRPGNKPGHESLGRKIAAAYGLTDRVEYVLGSGLNLPFEDGSFDGAFSTGSRHEWSQPEKAVSEILRVIKPGRRFFIGDLRRDVNPLIKALMWWMVRPKTIRPGPPTSLAAAYTKSEAEKIFAQAGATIKANPFGLSITGRVAASMVLKNTLLSGPWAARQIGRLEKAGNLDKLAILALANLS